MVNILPINLQTPKEMMDLIAHRFRQLRLHQNRTRAALAARAGINENTIKRFENTGQITLANLLRLALVMDAQQEFLNLFPQTQVQSIAALEKQAQHRQRARVKSK